MFAVGGVAYLIFVWIFRITEIDAGIYGLLVLSCAGILVLSVINPAFALLAGIFAIPLITIQFPLPIMGQILSFDKFLVVSFPLIWLVRCFIKGPPHQLGQCRNVVIAWGLTLIAITLSATIAWTENEFNQFHVKTFLEPLLIAFFFFAAYDVLAHKPSFAPKLVQALLISASLVLLGSSVQLIFELIGTSPPRLILMVGEKNFPFLARFSTLAHPNYMGAFVAFASALALGYMTNHRHDLKFISFWIIAGGALIVFFAKSLAGLFLFSTAISVGIMTELATTLGTKKNNGHIYRTAIIGIIILTGSAFIWGLPKIKKAVPFLIRAYPYKVVSPGIWSHPFFGTGPGSYPKVFQELEKQIPPKERPISRRPITKAMLRKFIRPIENGVILNPDESPIWLGYEIKGSKWVDSKKRTRSLLEGLVWRARIRANKPNAGRLYLQQRGSIRESVLNSKAESQVLFVSTPLRLRGISGWKVSTYAPDQRIEWAPGLDPTQQNGLKIFKTPFEMQFDLNHILKSKTTDKNLEGREIAVGAWVKSGNPGSLASKRKIRLRLVGGKRNFYSAFHPGDGRWHYLTIQVSEPFRSDRLTLIFEVSKEVSPVWIDGVFFKSGKKAINLLPGDRTLPPPSFTNKKEITILSLSEYLNEIKDYRFANKESKEVISLKRYLSPSQIWKSTKNSVNPSDFEKLTVGVVAEPGHGPVHFDNLELESPKGKLVLTDIWQSFQNEMNHPKKSGELTSSPWSLRIEGWANQVAPTLSAHSTFLAIAVELGLLGLLCILFLYGTAIWEVTKRSDISSRWNLYIALAMGVLLLSSLIEDTLLILRFSVLFWALAAAGLVGIGGNRVNASSY